MKKSGFRKKTIEEIFSLRPTYEEALQKASTRLKNRLKINSIPKRDISIKSKKKKAKKPKLASISKLKKDLWKLVSTYIRERDGIRCISCDRLSRKKGSNHAGHFLPSGNCGALLRYHPNNIHSQCYFCNVNMGGNGAVYYTKMIEKYGPDFVDRLFQIKNQITIQADRYFYTSMIELYKQGDENEIIKFLESFV